MFAALLLALLPGAPALAQSDTVTVTLQAGAAGMADTQIVNSAPSTNYATSTNTAVGELNNSSNVIGRGLYEFDLSGLPRDINITAAVLSLWVDADYSDNARVMSAYALLQPWTESGATWNNYAGTAWQTAGAGGANDMVSTAIGTVSMANNVSAGTKVDITLDPAAVQYMLRLDYIGFKLQMATENNDAYLFKSSDNATAGERPQLYLEYTPDIPIVDPGWQCRSGTYGTSYPFPDCPNYNDQVTITSPYIQNMTTNEGAYGAGRGLAAGEIHCSPFPKCINDFPIYYRVAYDFLWIGTGTAFANPTFWLAIPGMSSVYISGEIGCGSGTTGRCFNVIEGVIDVTQLPINTDGLFTIGLFASVNSGATLITSKHMEVSLYLSLIPFDQNCTDDYMVPTPETFEIDPTLETPLGVSGSPADNQIYTTVIGQVYAVHVKDGPWNDGAADRTDAAVSVDGTNWMTWSQFSITALCVDVDPYHPTDDYRILYFTATTTSFHIRVNDTAAAFADNTNNGSTPYSYVIGVAFGVPAPPSCEAQFTYDPDTDTVASVTVAGTSTDTAANNELTEPLEAGGWYGVEVASGTWNESGGTARTDMEFQFTTGGALGGSEWTDLIDGSALVQCTSTDGKTVFIQAPAQSGLTLHLRVNDQDAPQDWTDNSGTLGVNIYHATFERSKSGCELQFDLGSLVYHDTVAANAGAGKAFATSFASTDLNVSFSYGLTPGAWYVLDTTDGPWWLTFDSGIYDMNTYYYDAQVRSGTSGDWSSFDDWEFTECVVDLDALGHQRVYFQVPANGGIEYYIRAAAANPFGRGEIGWNLYEGVDISPPGGTIDGCNDFIFDPEGSYAGGGYVDASLTEGQHISGLETNTYSAIVIESAKEASDAPDYRKSGWYESAGGTETDALQITMDGTNWYDLPDHPGILCYYYEAESDQLVFVIQTLNNQSWKLRADSTTFNNNTGIEIYRTFAASAGDTLDPWTTCADSYTASVPAINEHEWIPPQDVEGVNLMPTLSYTPGNDPNNDGIIFWGDPGLQAGHDYMVETASGPWHDGENEDDFYSAQLSSDGGSTWYAFADHPDVICATHDQINHYWKAIFHADTGQVWKIRVADTETAAFTDNSGNLAYKLNLVNEFPVDGPGALVEDYNPGAFDVCAQSLVRPAALSLSEIGDVGNYLGDWVNYINRSVLSYFAWCPRHTDLLLSAVNALKNVEPLATIAEMGTVEKTVMQDVSSYDWGGGGYQDTSIFNLNSSSQVNNMVDDHILPTAGDGFDIWDGGPLVNFTDNQELPAYYYSCSNVFADYIPSKLKIGVCFASAYWKETGASFWLQLIFDIGTIFLLWNIIKGSVQSLVYMMTGVRPWTKDGANKMIVEVANGGDIVQPVDQWRYRR